MFLKITKKSCSQHFNWWETLSVALSNLSYTTIVTVLLFHLTNMALQIPVNGNNNSSCNLLQ